MDTLILVYNADTSYSSKMFDGIHKIISPSTYKCDLCLLTHDWFGEKETWKSFVKNHKSRFKMMYKNEFEQKYPLLKTTYPAIYTFNISTPVPKRYPVESINQLRNIAGLLTADNFFEKMLSELIISGMSGKKLDVAQFISEK